MVLYFSCFVRAEYDVKVSGSGKTGGPEECVHKTNEYWSHLKGLKLFINKKNTIEYGLEYIYQQKNTCSGTV
jgi:hypothetical protein